MVRAPCCEKMGLKKGPWTPQEDLILITYINQNGHGNWRALPKRAGLLRCGKSCRLRWMNYLRPDIKRGNFTVEEEETIIKLHQQLGNRWSVIAAKLPGRTDNEIKNVWHTHLKKRLTTKPRPQPETRFHLNPRVDTNSEPHSPPRSSSEISSRTTSAADAGGPGAYLSKDSMDYLLEADESFWSAVLSADEIATSDLAGNSDSKLQFSSCLGSDFVAEGGMDFWYNLFDRADDLVQLPEF